MRKLHVPVALVVILLAILGAVLHPLSMALSLTPLDTSGFLALLRDVRAVIADLLGWGVLGLLLVMLAYVIKGRLFERTPATALASRFPERRLFTERSTSPPRVAVAITAYNDAEATVDAVHDFLRLPQVVRVLVIDNNSTDETAELAAAAGAVVIRETRQGYGYACIRALSEGLQVPEADIIVLTEGDGTFVAEDTAKFLAYLDQADLVVGNRMVRGLVETDSQMDHFFTWGNMAVAMLVRLRTWDGRFLGPAGLTDVGCTFRAIRREALQRILPDLRVRGNHFSPHMLLVALAHGLSVIEIPIRFRRRLGESKGASRSMWSGVKVGTAMIWHIMTFDPGSVGRQPSVVVERDGVIIRHRRTNEHGPTQVELIPGAVEGLATLSRRGHGVIVVGDGSQHEAAGISSKLARAIDARIAAEVQHRGGHVDAFIVCPHRADQQCSCRHPQPQLLLRAARRSPLDLTNAIVVSDRPHFLSAAAGLGCRTILVGNGVSPSSPENHQGHHALDLAGAVELVLGPPLDAKAVANLQPAC